MHLEIHLRGATILRDNIWIFFLVYSICNLIQCESTFAINLFRKSDINISYSEAIELARVAENKSGVPLIINDSVMRELDFYLGTRIGRATIKRSLQRMHQYRNQIHQIFQNYNLPDELLAIPVIESGFQNLPESFANNGSAGLWQFLRGTARLYGLRVDNQIDERLHISRATDAAARHLRKLFAKFQDWHLSLVAYNQGEGRLKEIISTSGTKDPWKLERDGKIPTYLAKVMAVMIVCNHPKILDYSL